MSLPWLAYLYLIYVWDIDIAELVTNNQPELYKMADSLELRIFRMQPSLTLNYL